MAGSSLSHRVLEVIWTIVLYLSPLLLLQIGHFVTIAGGKLFSSQMRKNLDLNSLNVDRLQKAAKELSTNQVIADPLVRWLLKNITAIGVQVLGSFF
ncbi:hypothetical protein N7510_006628 [Penicillium lagena]|uniref:uncharacterized protein n=1 Tax=Penicillium lagena TaxID=94218 RepID=UPI002540F48B|nr:uncharacterized protein N7510_006628 [Penicillium lagena]KAJ5613434.1 hypothetical protein N7510_006628 [Penicillium lagena]